MTVASLPLNFSLKIHRTRSVRCENFGLIYIKKFHRFYHYIFSSILFLPCTPIIHYVSNNAILSPYLGFIFMCSWMYDISLCFDNLTQFHIHDMIISIKIFFIIFTYIHYIQFLKNFQKLHIMVFLYIFFFIKTSYHMSISLSKNFKNWLAKKNG